VRWMRESTRSICDPCLDGGTSGNTNLERRRTLGARLSGQRPIEAVRKSALQERLDLGTGNRLAPEKPLALIDAGRTQEESVIPGLHTLGDRAQAQCRREANDAAEHPRCRSVLENGREQAAIDFQNVEIETDDL